MDLPDEIGDEDYLAWLDNALSSGLRQFEPDLLCYIAGADPYREDQLGGLNLTIEGLKKRDELVFRVARARDIPVMVTFAGGYARRVDDTVTIHSNTVVAAKEVFVADTNPSTDRQLRSRERRMQRVPGLYPSGAGTTFDFDYYLSKRVPLVASLRSAAQGTRDASDRWGMRLATDYHPPFAQNQRPTTGSSRLLK